MGMTLRTNFCQSGDNGSELGLCDNSDNVIIVIAK